MKQKQSHIIPEIKVLLEVHSPLRSLRSKVVVRAFQRNLLSLILFCLLEAFLLGGVGWGMPLVREASGGEKIGNANLVVRGPTTLVIPSTVRRITVVEHDYREEVKAVAREVGGWWRPYALFWGAVHLVWAYEVIALTR